MSFVIKDFKIDDIVIYHSRSGNSYRGIIEQLPDPTLGQNTYTVFVKAKGRIQEFGEELTLENQIHIMRSMTVSQAVGKELDEIGALMGMRRHEQQGWSIETDDEYRRRLLAAQKGFTISPERNPHEGHEVVENYAGGKTFKYCRNCKIEVT